MKINEDILKNEVSAKDQTKEKFKLIEKNPNGKKVLFLGNSITLHETAPQIGWFHNWGMAASDISKDYVHLTVTGIEKKYGEINYCICNVGNWELGFENDDVLCQFKQARDFNADIVIVRIGENVKIEKLHKCDFGEKYEKFVKYFAGSSEKIVITSLFWEYEKIDEQIKKTAEKLNAEFVFLGDLGYDDGNKAIGKFENKGVASHPNDVGMKKIAERILEKI